MLAQQQLEIPKSIDAEILSGELALNANAVQPLLEVLSRRETINNDSFKVVKSELIRHKPGRRGIVRYDVQWFDGTSIRRKSLLGKIRFKGFDQRTYDLVRNLWRGKFGPHSRDTVQVPEPVGAIPELNMWLQRRIDANTLAAQLDAANATELCRVAAAALYKLHANGPRAVRRHDVGDEIRILDEGFARVRSSLPEFGGRIDRIQKACRTLAARLVAHEPSNIHRDFYPNQVLVRNDSAWLLDLDLYAEGDRAVDIGNFVAHLQETSLRKFGHCHGYSHLEHAFLEQYQTSSRQRLSLSIQTYVTLTLARHIAISRRFPSRHHTTEALIRACERRLSPDSAGFYVQ